MAMLNNQRVTSPDQWIEAYRGLISDPYLFGALEPWNFMTFHSVGVGQPPTSYGLLAKMCWWFPRGEDVPVIAVGADQVPQTWMLTAEFSNIQVKSLQDSDQVLHLVLWRHDLRYLCLAPACPYQVSIVSQFSYQFQVKSGAQNQPLSRSWDCHFVSQAGIYRMIWGFPKVHAKFKGIVMDLCWNTLWLCQNSYWQWPS